MRFIPCFCASLLLASSVTALAHGEGVKADLRGVTLCVDAASIRVSFRGAVSSNDRAAKATLQQEVRDLVRRTLSANRVKYVTVASCRGRDAQALLSVDVRYLDPRNYEGFGDPAYSYTVSVSVARAKGAGGSVTPRFTGGYSDIHSESRTRKSVRTVVTQWSKELTEDLAGAWRTANAAR